MGADASALGGKAKQKAIVARTLRWWDRNRRTLAWRAAPGETADPYRVWLSEVLLQQTTAQAAAPYYQAFIAKWPRVEDLAAAPIEAVVSAFAGLGYYSRARNLHACAREIARRGGLFPSEEAELRALPGIGAYTAAAIAAIAFGRQAAPVDGNIARILARLMALEQPIARARGEIERTARMLAPGERSGDFAQALMDVGATICRPRNPDCPSCPLAPDCGAFRTGSPEAYPRRLGAKSQTAPAGRGLFCPARRRRLPRAPPPGPRASRFDSRAAGHAMDRRGPTRRAGEPRPGRRYLAPAAGDGRTGLHSFCADPDRLRRGLRGRRAGWAFLGRARSFGRSGVLERDAQGGRARPQGGDERRGCARRPAVGSRLPADQACPNCDKRADILDRAGGHAGNIGYRGVASNCDKRADIRPRRGSCRQYRLQRGRPWGPSGSARQRSSRAAPRRSEGGSAGWNHLWIMPEAAEHAFRQGRRVLCSNFMERSKRRR